MGLLSKLKFYYQNVRGMRTKNKTFLKELIAYSNDVILLCETWLNEDFYGGGGCLIAIKSTLSSMRVREWELSKEDIWISIVLENGHRLNVNVRYVEDDSKLSDYEIHFKKIFSDFVLFGDYNLKDSIKWYTDAGIYQPKVNILSKFDRRISHEMLNMNSLCNPNQLSNVRNGLDRTLDLVLSHVDPSKIEVVRCTDPLVSEDDHHPALSVDIDRDPMKYLSENRQPKTNFYKADYLTLNEQLLDVDWELELSGLDVESAVNKFYEILESFIDKIPKVHYSKRDYPVYFTPRLIKLIKNKDRVRLSGNVNAFSKLRKQVKNEIKLCFANYVDDCETKLKSNTKCFFFSFTKSLRKTNSLANSMKYKDKVSNDRVSVCDLFANFFTSVYQSNVEVNDTSELNSLNSFYDSLVVNEAENISFSISDIQAVLKGFDANKASSPDGIPMMFYKNLAESLALPLSILSPPRNEENKEYIRLFR